MDRKPSGFVNHLKYGHTLHLSGEVLAGEAGAGLDPKTLDIVGDELARASKEGAKAAVVLGGGNIFRGLGTAAKGMDRVAADQMGMLATLINGLALKDAIIRAGGRAVLFNAFPVGPVAEPYSAEKARAQVEDGVVTILSDGTGNPYFSTDSAAALRAAELRCDLLTKGRKVDGVYDKDPEKHADAKRFNELTIDEMLEKRLGVMDLTAATLCRENHIDIRVYKMTDKDIVRRTALGEPLGTLVKAV